MTPDYSKLGTAALVEAADALTAGITPGEWQWTASDHRITGLEADNDGDVGDVIWSSGKSLVIDDDDAAFIAAAPALVREMVARLREEAAFPTAPLSKEKTEPDSAVGWEEPPPAKFKVGDRVQLKSWHRDNFLEWKAGTILTVYGMMYDDRSGNWSYDVGDDISTRATTEYNLEPVTNG